LRLRRAGRGATLAAVLIAAQHLVDRLRYPRSRADEVATLRRRFAGAAREPATAEEREVAAELLRLRRALAEALAFVTSCAGCSRGHPLPHGRWDGGHCCGTRTELVFTDDEVAALGLSGTTPARLVPPSGDHAGCSFRGPTGCSLDVADRPNICVRFICRELDDELREGGDRAAVRAIAAELGKAFERWRRLRALRASDLVLGSAP
jgi:hypothetical protein